MASSSHQSLTPTELGRVDEEMVSPVTNYRDPKDQEPWKVMGNSGHGRSNPEAPGESRGCLLSPNHRL
ncbi:hypothetical protein TNCV_3717231 [Trichonephila clavipes]|nr:hypothetical protein TNCV_3717231 [Trichonephila clavipes]